MINLFHFHLHLRAKAGNCVKDQNRWRDGSFCQLRKKGRECWWKSEWLPVSTTEGICMESERVIYICNAQTNSIKTCTEMVQCAEFLNFIDQLFYPFSIHSKGGSIDQLFYAFFHPFQRRKLPCKVCRGRALACPPMQRASGQEHQQYQDENWHYRRN